jgi:hypothetical protein
MNTSPQAPRTVKLWQLLLVNLLVAIALGLLPDQRLAVKLFLLLEAALILGLLGMLTFAVTKRFRNK